MAERTRRSWSVIAVALLIALQTATPALAWGRLGHRVISRLAEKHMTPAAKAGVAALCGIERLEPPMRRDDFQEMELVEGRFSEELRPLGEPAWTKMHHSGLVCVRDPFIQHS